MRLHPARDEGPAAAISRSKVALRSSSTLCCSGLSSNQRRTCRAPWEKGTVQMNSGTNPLTLLLSKIIEWDLSPSSEGPRCGAAAAMVSEAM